MYFVSPKAGEKYYLRLLLCHVRGAKDWDDLLKVDGVLYPTYKEACIGRGLLEDDKEWDRCLDEVKEIAMPRQLRQLFAVILEYNHPERPGDLWRKYLYYMIQDKKHAESLQGLPFDDNAEARCANAALWDLEQLLRAQGLSVENFPGMPVPHRPVGPVAMSEYMRAEVCYDREKLNATAEVELAKCTEEQRHIVNACMGFVDAKTADVKLMFIDSPAGGGKTFLLNLLLSLVRGRGEIALAMASTGIAAMLLAGGTTAHSRFGIPVPVNDESTSTIRVTTERATVIREASLIIWDEITMADKHAVECASRLCQEIMSAQEPALERVPFGGKVVIFAGDWRQVLPVVVRGGRAQVVNACLKSSMLWEQCLPLFYFVPF
jgi:hypothetical protein